MPPPFPFGWASVRASTAHMQAHQSLGVRAGTWGDPAGGGSFPAPSSPPQQNSVGAGASGCHSNASPGTGVGAGPNSKATELLTKVTGTTEQFSLEDMIYCINYAVFIFFFPFKHRSNERSIKIPSFLPKSSSCVMTFLKIQGLVLPAAKWQFWLAPHAELRHTQMEKVFKDHLSK